MPDSPVAGSKTAEGPGPVTANVVWHQGAVTRADRVAAYSGSGAVVWFTGLSGSGKSTVASEVERLLVAAGRPAYLLDGDNLRHGINGDLGFSERDRSENIRRAGEVACLFADAGVVAVVSLISPFRADRSLVRTRAEAVGVPFVEVFMDTPLAVCEERDPKGLYRRARSGELANMTGISSPYETPEGAEVELRPELGDPEMLARRVIAALG